MPRRRHKSHVQAAWGAVLCVVALDYLSTLAYQPSIAFHAAGRLAPLATVVVVLVTLFAALPVYLYVAGRSPHGGGAVALLERLIPGWRGKLLIVILLGFTATDFVFTRTFSAAAAAEHLIHNPQPEWQDILDRLARWCGEYGTTIDSPFRDWLGRHADKQLVVTLIVLLVSSVPAALFFRGINRGLLRTAILVVAIYLLLNAIVLVSGVTYLVRHPGVVVDWWQHVAAGDWGTSLAPHAPQSSATLIAAACGLFPKLALGLSGFELTMIVMPLVRGSSADDPRRPLGRVWATRKMLVAAALLGSVALIASATVTSLLIPPQAFSTEGRAAHRALAYLAHGGPIAGGEAGAALSPVFGPAFGTAYDAGAVAILCLTGMSIGIALRDHVPPYLHRLGMELNWSASLGVLVYLFVAIKFVVTVYFRADLEAQRFAYATAVLALLTAAAAACAVDRWECRPALPRWQRAPWLFGAIATGFAAATAEAVWSQPAGLRIASLFVLAILLTSMISRAIRSTELRFQGFEYVDDNSRFLWDSLRTMDFPVLVPHRSGQMSLAEKEAMIREFHRLPPDVPVVFVEVTLGDPSGFENLPMLEVTQTDGRFIIRVERCTSIPHVLAAVALEMSKVSIPPEIHFGWSEERPLTANLHFVLFGHGNVPWMVQYLLSRAERDPCRRPRVIIG
ncbi:MAG TPA: amino acid transporter [Gemmataceae bacterium]|nr:amino acid transporter [Gemmataceae bacterium]